MKLTLILFFLAFTNDGYSQIDTTGHKTIFAKDNYEIQFPNSWRLDTSKVNGTELYIFSPLENAADKFSENVNFIIQDLRGQNIDLEQYKQITDKQLIDMATDSQVYESSILKTGNKNYYKVTYAMTQGKFRLKITSVCFIDNDKGYVVTFCSEFDKYDNYKNVGEEILGSFKLVR